MPKRLEDTPNPQGEKRTLFDVIKEQPLPHAIMLVFNTIAQAMGRDEKPGQPPPVNK